MPSFAERLEAMRSSNGGAPSVESSTFESRLAALRSTPAETARARLAARGLTPEDVKAGRGVSQPAGPDTPGYFGSAWRAVGGPTSVDEIKHRLTPGPQWVPGLEQALAMKDSALKAKTPAQGLAVINQANPMALPMTQIGEGNYSGALGTLTPTIIAALAGGGPKAMENISGRVGGMADASSFATRTPTQAPTALPEVWNGPPPSGFMPVYGETIPEVTTTAPPSLRAKVGEYLIRDIAGRTVGPAVSDLIKGRIAKPQVTTTPAVTPQIGSMDLSQSAAFGDAPSQSGSATNAFVSPRPVPEYSPPYTGDPGSRGSIPLAEPSPLPSTQPPISSADWLLNQYMSDATRGESGNVGGQSNAFVGPPTGSPPVARTTATPMSVSGSAGLLSTNPETQKPIFDAERLVKQTTEQKPPTTPTTGATTPANVRPDARLQAATTSFANRMRASISGITKGQQRPLTAVELDRLRQQASTNWSAATKQFNLPSGAGAGKNLGAELDKLLADTLGGSGYIFDRLSRDSEEPARLGAIQQQ